MELSRMYLKKERTIKMGLKHGNQKNKDIAEEVQNAYDFLRQGSDLVPTSYVELSDKFYGMLQDLEDLKEEVERTLE